MGQITSYSEVTELVDNNVFLIDGPNGTKKIKAENLLYALLDQLGTINHRRIFRGKYLGSTFTSEQKAAIQNGTFKDLWLGDYWTINGVNYRIVDIDYWYGKGDSPCTTHHVTVMPDANMVNSKMQNSDTTQRGYIGTIPVQSVLGTLRTTILTAFGSDSILLHRGYFIDAMNSYYPVGGNWYDSRMEVPSEHMIFGCPVTGITNPGNISIGLAKSDTTQLALFDVDPHFIASGGTYWLRDTVNSSQYSAVDGVGTATKANASQNLGIRPVFGIKGVA